MNDTLFIFFISGARLRRKMSWRTRIRILRRWPGKSYSMFLARLTMFLTRSEWCHCSIGYMGHVLDPLISGSKIWPLHEYTEKRRGVLEEYAFRVVRPPMFWADTSRAPVMPSLIRYVTCGRFPFTRDCVCVTLNMMRQAGINVPRTIVSPKQLRNWVKEHAKYSTL